MATGDLWEVTASSLNVRSGPGTGYSVVAGLVKGQKITETDNYSGWIKYTAGWCAASHLKWLSSAGVVNTTTTNSSAVSEEDKTAAKVEAGEDTAEENNTYRPSSVTDVDGFDEFMQNVGEDATFSKITAVNGVFGLPYQFLPTADARTNGSDVFGGGNDGIGTEYAEKIVSKIPLLFIAPGRPSFMTKYTDSEKKGVLAEIITSQGLGSYRSSLEDLISKDGRYYTFEYALNDYYSYVNPMCRIAARYLELHNVHLDGQRLDMIDWGSYNQRHSRALGNYTEYSNIGFYVDTDTSVSEGFGNSLGESSLASTVNGISDLGRELNFLTGYTSRALDSNWFEQNADAMASIENLDSMVTDILGKGSFVTNLSKHLSTVAAGGRLIFPKIWNDSDFSRSYNVRIKLVSPDCNKLSIFLNILVPLFHLIGLVAPQSVPDNPNGYVNPFIVRSIYKSFFNVDMGIITDMSIEKGGNCMWTVDGLPTSVEVSMTIKDLYDAMSITATNSTTWKYDTLNNTAQMDYIANLCGINMYKPEVGRMVSMWLVNNFVGRAIDVPRNIWRTINQTLSSSIINLFRSY